MSFLAELKRRKVAKVGVAYAAVGWLLVQIAATFFPALQLPAWTVTLVASLIILGFPLALLLAWAYEITPDGVGRGQPPTDAVISRPGRKLDFAIIAALGLALTFFVYQYVNEPDGGSSVGTVDGLLPNSIAVLPFDNLSPNEDNAYFAAGIHESTLNQLVKIQDLSVIARTSVLPYGDNPIPIPEIAQALKVEMVMEGSVRYADERVLIAAQLIDGRTGAHIWSEEFERGLTDVFAVQAEIATRIAMALETQLSSAEQESLSVRPTESDVAYALYLHALEALSRDRNGAVEYAEQAIALDENFALAHAIKARALARSYAGEVSRAARESPQAALALANALEGEIIEAAERALQIDSTLGLAHAALGVMHLRRWRRDEAEAAFSRAYALTPNDPEVLNWYSFFYTLTDQFDESIDMALRAAELDPQNSLFELAQAYFFAGRFDIAASTLAELRASQNAASRSYQADAEFEAARGNSEAALQSLAIQESFGFGGAGSHARGAYVYSILRRDEDAARLFDVLQQLPASPIQLAAGYLSVGNTDAALRLLREAADSELPVPGSWLTIVLKNNLYDDQRLEQPEFVEVRNRLGFAE